MPSTTRKVPAIDFSEKDGTVLCIGGVQVANNQLYRRGITQAIKHRAAYISSTAVYKPSFYAPAVMMSTPLKKLAYAQPYNSVNGWFIPSIHRPYKNNNYKPILKLYYRQTDTKPPYRRPEKAFKSVMPSPALTAERNLTT